MRVTPPTPQEARVLDGVTRRVETYDTHQLFYDFNEPKKVESRATEAVLNALILASVDAEKERRVSADVLRRAFQRLWETQRADGAWDWLDFGLEPFESAGATYYGATLAALAVGAAGGSPALSSPEATAGMNKLRAYLTERYAGQNLFNRTWALLAATRWKDLLPVVPREALIAELRRAQQADGGWSLEAMSGWRWSKAAWRAKPPGTPDAALLARSDGHATGLVVYTLRSAGVGPHDPSVTRGVQWLKSHQQDVAVGERSYPAWRSYSLNHDREHGGEKGEPWRRFFMSDAATAFAVLALLASE
jgi:squalene-hopene/tetraprenyl-beta-curcumene cyclase